MFSNIFSQIKNKTIAAITSVASFFSRISNGWRMYANRFSLVIIIVVGGTCAYLYTHTFIPPENFPTGELISVPAGKGVAAIGAELKAQHAIQSVTAFRIAAFLTGHERAMHAGDYMFKQPVSVWSIARAISIGAYGLEPIRFYIRDGATAREMATLYGSQLQHFSTQRFLERVQDERLEGKLFPDTYFFLPNVTEDTVIGSMEQNFNCHVFGTGDHCTGSAATSTSSLAQAIAKSGKSLDDIITMASILEKEGMGINDDRKKIAGVLWNRIDKKMPLQVDAVFSYTLGKGSRQLTLTDLRSDSPYNTYKQVGLPPTAIGSPSLDSIIAAANPIKSANLFYLADRNHNTYYSKTYAQHARLKALYIDSQK